jgi:hypothetical protein
VREKPKLERLFFDGTAIDILCYIFRLEWNRFRRPKSGIRYVEQDLLDIPRVCVIPRRRIAVFE